MDFSNVESLIVRYGEQVESLGLSALRALIVVAVGYPLAVFVRRSLEGLMKRWPRMDPIIATFVARAAKWGVLFAVILIALQQFGVQPTSLLADVAPGERGYAVQEPYYRSGPLPPVDGSLHREAGTLEYLHRWEELLGGLCRAGFWIEDIREPYHADVNAAKNILTKAAGRVASACGGERVSAPAKQERDHAVRLPSLEGLRHAG